MEQVQATINYFIREKLWCSIRRLTDLVSQKYNFKNKKAIAYYFDFYYRNKKANE